jgi:predicted metalloprotease with PDZ domain
MQLFLGVLMLRKMIHFRFTHLLLMLLVVSAPAAAQSNRFRIDYTVEVQDPDAGLFHVTADIRNIRQPSLELSLPTWTPGWYTIENYFKNVLRFTIKDPQGKRLGHTMTRKQTWRVETAGRNQIIVEFDYRADTLGLNQAKITKDFAFFTGTQLFLMADGHRASPSSVRFVIPPAWKIISALDETSDPFRYTAPDYDTLVDAPTQMGHFDVASFEVEGKPHYFVATPAGAFSAEKTHKFTQMLAKVAVAQSAIFRGLPYRKYIYFYFFLPPESNASGALEHQNSHISFAPPGNVAEPENMIGTASHEFFHTWNVKRIRPADMWPYDYSREDESPLLWISEGFTNYYGVIGTYRAGVTTKEAFLERAAGAMSDIENNPARSFISPAESSVSTWVGYDTPVAFGISYYTQGQNLGALLDLSIRHDSGGRSSLDDVMRALYREHYLRGRGFTTEDTIRIINRLTRRDYHDFYRRYVWGVEVPPYEKIFGYAGYRVEQKSAPTAVLGFDARFRGGGLRVQGIHPNSPATEAGLEVGDVITKLDGTDIRRAAIFGLAGRTVKLTIKRGEDEKEVTMRIGSREATGYHLSEIPQPTAAQLKVRAGWLGR